MSSDKKNERRATLYGVGVGPGDPELITLKAVRVISEAGVVAIPDSGMDGVAYSIVSGLDCLEGKEILKLPLPMTKDKERLVGARRSAARLISEKLSAGVDVAFVTLGDPFFYSTFGYLIPFVEELLEDFEIVTIPGVTSLTAASASVGFPLVESEEGLAVVADSGDSEGVREALLNFDTIVVLKIAKVIDALVELVEELGLTRNAWVVSRASWPEETLCNDIASLKGTRLDYFSVMVVKKKGSVRA